MVTAPFLARALPDNDALVFNVMLVSARRLPSDELPVPKVAELPICQNIFCAQLAPPVLIRAIDEFVAVVSVLPILNRKNALEFPCKSRISVPVRAAAVEKQYTPGVNVRPPRFWPVKSTLQVVPAAVL